MFFGRNFCLCTIDAENRREPEHRRGNRQVLLAVCNSLDLELRL